MVEPKMAIACRSKIEINVALRAIEKAGINWSSGDKATNTRYVKDFTECRLYISPPDEWKDEAYLMYDEDPEDTEDDDDDEFEWQYIEASELFRNQIISERRKHGTAT